MKSPISFLLMLAIATTRAAAGYHAVRRRASINNSTETDVTNGCPLCTCNDAAPSAPSDDIIEVSVLVIDVQVSSNIVSYLRSIALDFTFSKILFIIFQLSCSCKSFVHNLNFSNCKGIIDMVLWNARDYEKFTNGRVKINIKTVPTMPALFEEIESDARNGGGLYDAYYTNPLALGTAVALGGLLDLTKYVKESKYSEWVSAIISYCVCI